ncbi:LppP/LprE family lipoprotein [Herbiconiux liangxiaofengii]|uniref:LppP/LprE family lipoprotein n=1 Tax=Herbiconiux liangxiaofengii TaxID=3342795 RepID=UPI0035B71A2E
MRTRRRISRLLLGSAVVVMLAGCAPTSTGAGGSTTSPSSSATPSTPSASATPTPTPTPTPTCGPADGRQAAAAAIAALPAPEGLSDAVWDAEGADYSGYDPCAALSWTVVTLQYATVSSPNAVLLFHSGTYLGTATSTPYGFTPAVERLSDDSISVTYRFTQGTESNAEASGRATATFSWNAATGSVDMTGDVPPGY